MFLDIKGQVTPACSRSHISYSFHLEEPVSRLIIRFSYSPKRLEDEEQSQRLIMQSIDKYTAAEHREYAKAKWTAYLPLQNLITVSMDDPERHRGRDTAMIRSRC
ncbi:hypothetical protein LJK88_28245 [Paenibacillus sp. P26]|nr:hypothetical protein LJK88_28245 [Paenibacillus sp. P26]